MLTGCLLIGSGLSNWVEGVVDHHVLKIHPVNETVSPGQWIYWGVGFLVLGGGNGFNRLGAIQSWQKTTQHGRDQVLAGICKAIHSYFGDYRIGYCWNTAATIGQASGQQSRQAIFSSLQA